MVDDKFLNHRVNLKPCQGWRGFFMSVVSVRRRRTRVKGGLQLHQRVMTLMRLLIK